jgi:hypothetical protein
VYILYVGVYVSSWESEFVLLCILRILLYFNVDWICHFGRDESLSRFDRLDQRLIADVFA